MPLNDIVPNSALSNYLKGDDCMSKNPNRVPPFPPYPPYPPFPPHPHHQNCCPPDYPPYPYCPPVNPGISSIEGQIAKLSKKSATIRKMIDGLVNKKKSMIISTGPSASYNFGVYLNAEGEETEYGASVLEILQAELEAIKAKIVELTGELEVEDLGMTGIEETVVGD